MRILFSFLLLFVTIIHDGHCQETDLDDIRINLSSHEPLFVSLGSHCNPAHVLRACGFRKAAFPFDWVMSTDGEKLAEMFDIETKISEYTRCFQKLIEETKNNS